MNEGINRRELTYKALAGLAGGALGWVPVEITSRGHSLTEAQTPATVVASFVSMALLSGLIGGLILASEQQSLELTPIAQRRFLRGFVICFLLSLPATYYSNLAFTYILTAGGWGVNQAGSVVYLIAGRLAGWTLMGVMLGAGVGIASFSLSNLLKGAAGGWVGGFVGGLAFDLVGATTSGTLSRLVGTAAIGLAIGLFIGLVQELTKQAWVKVEAGRLRGREFRLDRGIASLGRAEENEVGLFGDPGVLARHARIERRGDAFILKDLSTQQGTFLNGQRIESAELHDNDRIKISNYELSFHARRGGAGSRSSAPARPAGAAVSDGATSFAAAPPAAAASLQGPRLIDLTGRNFALAAGATMRLGRALDNDLVLEDASVSRHHASISASNGAFHLKDLGSQNGTYVRGERITEAMLADGDAIRLGDAQLTFHS
ncbi:MAG TPA: FHA domain-containing protein [Candidatus Binataceae bacterium]|nr:FHA domain-containing protein [Candidatus Binataceae bacterium]